MENTEITVEILKISDELWTLENAFLEAVGEERLNPQRFHQLAEAVKAEKIIFFAARKKNQLIGMCSISLCFSTYACKPCAVFDDFFVRPEYRGQGVARKLVKSAQLWCKTHECASMIVSCSCQDAAMYRSLGFDTELGVMLANNL